MSATTVTPVPVPTSNGHTNGHSSVHVDDLTNAQSTSTESHLVQTNRSEESLTSHTSRTESRTMTTSGHTHTFTSDQHVTVLRQTVIATRSLFISELFLDADYIDSMKVGTFLDYLERERLTHMPHRGSRWDKVLKWAEFFALQISRYADAVHSFVPDSKNAAKMIWAASRSLIKLGGNSEAIEVAFEMFYKVGLSLFFFLQYNTLLSANSQIRTEVGQALNELLVLVRDVSFYYHTRISGLSSGEVSIDFSSVFSKNISAFYSRKDRVIDAMWECRLGDDCANVRVIRQWLDIRDNITRTIVRQRIAASSRRDEYTCEWMGRYLLDFTRGTEDVLAITGPSGSGKTVLAGWIVERLQTPLDKKRHETLSIIIDPDIPSEFSAFAIAKKLASQLLKVNIGDVELLNALERVHHLYTGQSSSVLEAELWKAIDVGLKFKAESLMIVIDGLDDKLGHHNASEIGKKLAAFALRHKHVRAIILSRNSAYLDASKTKVIAIAPDNNHDDLQHITGHAFKGCEHFTKQNDHEKEAIVEKVTHAAKGNFLIAQLIAKSLKQQVSFDAFTKAVKSIKDAPPLLEGSIQQLVSTATADFAKPETRLLLSWLLVAERPLAVSELKGLLQVDLQKKTLTSRNTDIVDDIQHLCGPLVNIQNGIVRFRHGAIREYLVKVQAEGKKLPTIQSAQGDLTIRLLAYCNLRFSDPYDLGFERPDSAEIDRLFLQDTLLEYATRNWILHFKKSSWHKVTGSLELPNDFKANFPGSVYFSMVEWACWEPQTPAFEAIDLHNLALRLRQAVFTEKHRIVLQTLIICGSLYKKLSNFSEAGSCFYHASRIGQSILKANSVVTITCTTKFLEVTETITSTTRTDIITKKEEMLQYAITSCKLKYGKTSDTVIRYYTMLAEMYVAIHEEHKAEAVYRELHEIIIIRHGKGSVEEITISGRINVVLKADKHAEIIEYEKEIFSTDTEVEIWDVSRITVTLKLAAAYEAHGELLKVEELYVMLWSRLLEHCHQIHIHQVDITVHISMIDVALEYVRFLRRYHRHEEAAGVLICIWNEYEEYDFESEVIFLRLKLVGELMRAVSLFSIAISVFRKCWSWFSSHGKYEHVESCQILISETTEEIITSTKTTTVSTTTTTTTETIMKEVFESTISKSTVTKETISICRSLVSFYLKSEQWTEAIKISKKSLHLIWRVVISGGGTVALPREFAAEAMEIAFKLAICHQRLHHYHEAESIYIRIYRACFNSCQIHDERLTNAYTALIKFYQEHEHWHKVIEVYQEVLIASRMHLGGTHALTIKILYELGSLCSKHGHGHAHEYYEEIITVLNGKSHVCHRDSLRAMQIMCKIYYEEGHWEKLKIHCEILWENWTKHHAVHKFEAEFIELLYMRYIYVLQHHYATSFEIIRTITIQFRDTCIIVFGASAAVTIRALVELAQVCMRSEKHIHEAISYYEEVIKTVTTSTKTTTTTTTTTISSTTISTVKQELTKAYIHVCTHGSVSSTTLERAIFILTERFEHLKIQFSCSHIETLTVLRELIQMHWKQKTIEAKSIVVHLLLETTIAIISHERHSRTLYEAAKTMGSIYVTCGLVEEARKMLNQIHRQIVSKSYASGGKTDFKIDPSVGRGSYVFLATFEEIILSSSSLSYSKIMADLLTETILYESYSRCLKSKTETKTLLSTGARLYVFLSKNSRSEQVTIVQEQLHSIFLKEWGSSITTRKEITIVFFVGLLQVLGNTSHQIEIDHAACKSSNDKVRELMLTGQFKEAYEVALCAFQFLEHRGAYHHLQNIGYSFKLSAYMASRGLKKLTEKPIDPELRPKMLELSKDIICEVLKAFKHSEISVVRLKIGEINDLIGLLGEQQNYAELEWVLSSLWSSREFQKTWSSDIIIEIGKRFVQARFLGGHSAEAISLCETICYNLRRVWGALDSKTLEMSDLLSQIYTQAGHHREAMRLHGEILRLIVEGDDGDDRTPDTVTAKTAKHHLLLLQASYQRLGGWDNNASSFKKLVDQLLKMPEYKSDPLFKGVQGTDKWNVKDKPDTTNEFTKPVDWEFVDPASLTDKGEVKQINPSKNQRLGFRRVTSNWGMSLVHQSLDSDYEEMPTSKKTNGAKKPFLLI